MRDDFPQKVKDTLAKRVGYKCSNPACRCLTSGPQIDKNKSINVGVASHITAASSGGPRYDDKISSSQRNSIENGIWLCEKCAKLIDTDVIRFPTELLRKWGKNAEQAAFSEVQGGSKRLGSRIETLNKSLELILNQEKRAHNLLKERHGDPYSEELAPQFKGTSILTPGIYYPFTDTEVKNWYFETISILESTLGKSNDCLKGMKKLRKKLLIDDINFVDGEFNTFDTGKLLIFSIDVLHECVNLIEKNIETLNKI